jgi:hypothetical protein
VPDAPDFRTERSDSPEGTGHARTDWLEYHESLPSDVLAEAFGGESKSIEDYPDDVAQDIAEQVVEDSDLIGFWIAWHQAGGFANLQAGGWHRATIFRRLRRFRARYDAHPDDYRFDWITLDLPRAWGDNLRRRLAPGSDEPPAKP